MSVRRIGRAVLRLLKGLAVMIAVLLGGGAVVGGIYQWLGVRTDRAELPPPGELVSIGSHALHIQCMGRGAQTVLLDAGAGGWSMHWWMYQQPLSTDARVCVFDRSGLGWSDEGPGAYDGESMSRELHALLEASDISAPVVYVGHSLGANLGQIHYRLFPADIAGLVIIDPGLPEDLLEDFTGTRAEAMTIDSCGWKCGAASVATRLGVTRFAVRNAGRRSLGEERHRLYRAGLSRQSAARTVMAYLEFLPRTAYQNIDSSELGNVPLTVVYSGDTRNPEGDETEADVDAWHRHVLIKMSELAAGSTRGRGPVVVEGATHQSITTDDEYVAQVLVEIRRVIEMASG